MSTSASPLLSRGSERNRTLARLSAALRIGARLATIGVLLLPGLTFLGRETAFLPRLCILAVFFVTLLAPNAGAIACTACLPVAGIVSALLGSRGAMVHPALFTFLGAWVLGDTARGHRLDEEGRPSLVLPALLFASVVAASMIVQLAVQQATTNYPWPFYRDVIAWLGSDFAYGSTHPGFGAGAVLLEGVGLFVAVVVLCRRSPVLAGRLAIAAVAGAMAVAALNLSRVAHVAVQNPALFETLLTHPRNLRISATAADANAAASYLAMALLTAVGVAAVGRRARWGWTGAAIAILVAMWFNGSRTAPAAMLVAAAVVFSGRVWRLRWRRRSLISAGVVVTLLAVVVVHWFSVGYLSLSEFRSAVVDRSEFSLAAVRAFADHPVFGVEIGRFYTSSSRYIVKPEVRQFVVRENAHNNFLQILAELGIVGFACFAWLLGVVAWRARAAGKPDGNRLLAAVAAALLAFLLTCLVGHPLLTTEIALAFWGMLGVGAALGAPGARPPIAGRERRRVAVAAVLVALAASVPARARWTIDHETDLGRAAIGFSPPASDPGPSHRTMTDRARFYVPGSTCEIRLSFRLDAASEVDEAEVEIGVDGQAVNRLRATRESWRELKVFLRVESGRRFRRVDLQALGGRNVAVMVTDPGLASCSRNQF